MTQAFLAAELLAGNLDDLPAFDRARQRMLADYRRLTAMVLSASRWDRLFPFWLRLLRTCPRLFSHAVGVSGGVRRLLPGVLA
jgi:hypothetical protein